MTLSGTGGSGNFVGLRFGYADSGAYDKGGIFYKNTDSAYAKGELHFAVDSVNDAGNADLTDSKMIIANDGKVTTANSTAYATGFAPFQISYVNQFTNLGTTPQSITYLGGNAFIAHFFMQTATPSGNPHQCSFTIYGGRQAAVAHRFTGYAGGNCTLNETSEGVFSITGLGDGVTYTLTINKLTT